MKHIALLRGINVGGNKKVPMADLRKMMEKIGFKGVKTLLNSGNVFFESKMDQEEDVLEKISKKFMETFGFEVKIVLREMQQIQKLIDLAPFKEIEADKDTRLYVSFLGKEIQSDLKLPYCSPDMDFKILQKTKKEVFSVLYLKNARSVDAMAVLEKEYGKDITTRNWNTVKKIAAL